MAKDGGGESLWPEGMEIGGLVLLWSMKGLWWENSGLYWEVPSVCERVWFM